MGLLGFPHGHARRSRSYVLRPHRILASALVFSALGCTSKHPATEINAVEQKDAGPPLEPFSFFVTSLAAMQELSGSPDGFGGDLRFGETGEGAGLRGADKICTTIAEKSMPGSGKKGWRAFLSAVAAGPGGAPVHAADRIGEGPWFDRLGRIVSMNKSELIQQRPAAHEDIKDDLPNEFGVPNHNPDGTGEVDNHDTLTGSNEQGQLYAADMRSTCNDWTKSERDTADQPRVGHSWPRRFGDFGRGGFPDGGFPGFPGRGGPPPGWDGGVPPGFPGRGGPPSGNLDGGVPPGFPGRGGPPPGWDGGFPDFSGFGDPANWMSSLNEAGCGPGAMVVEMGPPIDSIPTVGSGGGYGGIYCFALTP